MTRIVTSKQATARVTSASSAVAAAKCAAIFPECAGVITEAGEWNGETVYCPGGGFTSFYIRDFVFMLDGSPASFTADNIRVALDWYLSHQIKNAITAYTGPDSGASILYPLGTVPDRIAMDGTASYLAWGDKPSTDNQFFIALLARHYAVKLNWNAAWDTWWAANGTDIESAYNSVYENRPGHDGLISQDRLYPGTMWGFLDQIKINGCDISCSILAYRAAQQIAEMREHAGQSITLWRAREYEHRQAVQRRFKKSEDIFPAYPESIDESLHIRWDAYQPGVTPVDWTNEGGGGSAVVVQDPHDSTRSVLMISDTTTDAGIEIYKNFSGNYFTGLFTRIRIRAMAAQTTMDGSLIRIYGNADAPYELISLAFMADMSVKFFTANNQTQRDLPNGSYSYVANAWYDIELRLDRIAKSIEILIDGVSQGTEADAWTDSTAITQIRFTNALNVADYTGTCYYSDIALGYESTDTSTYGWLPASTDYTGAMPLVDASAYAVWAGILTEDQAQRVGRWLKRLYNQPVAAGTNGNLFHRPAADATYTIRHVAHSDEARHGTATFPSVFTAQTYGNYMDGGYWYHTIGWALYAIALVDQDTANALITNILNAANADANAPYECINEAGVGSAKYAASAAACRDLFTSRAAWQEYFYQLTVEPPATTTKLSQILAAYKTRLETITTANGYNTNLGEHVSEWDTSPLDLNVQTQALDYKYETISRKDVTVGGQDMGIIVTVRIRTVGATSLADMQNEIDDVSRAIHLDPTYDNLADDTNQTGDVRWKKAQAKDQISEAEIDYKIEYQVNRGES